MSEVRSDTTVNKRLQAWFVSSSAAAARETRCGRFSSFADSLHTASTDKSGSSKLTQEVSFIKSVKEIKGPIELSFKCQATCHRRVIYGDIFAIHSEKKNERDGSRHPIGMTWSADKPF